MARGHAPQFMAADLSNIAVPARGHCRACASRSGPFTRAAQQRRQRQASHAVEDTTPEFWDASVAVNLKHQFFTAQAVLPDMKDGRWWLDHQLRLHQLDAQTGRHAGVHGQQVRQLKA